MYDHDPGGFVVLVIGHCVNTTEAKMETAHLVKEDGRDVDTAVTLKGCFSLLTLSAMHTPAHTNVDGYFRRARRCQHGTA